MSTAKFVALCALAFVVTFGIFAGPRAPHQQTARDIELAAIENDINERVARQMSDPCHNLNLPVNPDRNCSGHSEPTTIVIKVQ